jgi:hypothetical protein
MADYDELRRLAEAATPGPWQTDDANRTWVSASMPLLVVADCDVNATDDRKPNAAFIAAVNPQTVLALLDALAAKDAALKRYVQTVADTLHYDMKAILSDTPEHRMKQQLSAMTAARDEACDGWRQFVMHDPTATRAREWLERINQLRGVGK